MDDDNTELPIKKFDHTMTTFKHGDTQISVRLKNVVSDKYAGVLFYHPIEDKYFIFYENNRITELFDLDTINRCYESIPPSPEVVGWAAYYGHDYVLMVLHRNPEDAIRNAKEGNGTPYRIDRYHSDQTVDIKQGDLVLRREIEVNAGGCDSIGKSGSPNA